MHISIIDDEKVLTNKISKKLKLNWYSVSEYYSYKDFLQNWNYTDISDLFILDLSLWDGSGFDIIKHIRNNKKLNTPIIIISWFWDSQNVIFWLDLWADDYLTKPFLPEELLARVRAVLRRPKKVNVENKAKYKNITIDNTTKEVFLDDEKVSLTKKEVLLLDLFINNIWVLIEKEKLVNYIWWVKSSLDVSDNTINVTISTLRKKLWWNFLLKTKHNLGYILE